MPWQNWPLKILLTTLYDCDMDKTTKEKLNKITKEIFGVEASDNLSMDDVPGWDSLRHIQLLVKIEKEFGVEIDFQDTLKMTNIKSIGKILEKYVHKK